MLNKLWTGFFVVAMVAALAQFAQGDVDVFSRMVTALFDMAKTSVDIMLLMFGMLTLWMGFLKIAEEAGVVAWLSRLLSPLFARLMSEVPRGHPALGLVTMNFAANGLGLDNAATPIGLKAMRSLQSLNPSRDTASNAQILFLVMNASSLTLLPMGIFVYRMQQGADNPTLVFLPILLATAASSLAGLLSVILVQRIKLRDPVLLAWLGGMMLGLSALIAGLLQLHASTLATVSSVTGNLLLLSVIVLFLLMGAWKRIPVFDRFIDGAKEGFDVAKDLLPYLVAMLCAIGLLRASGTLDVALDAMRWLVDGLGMDNRFVDALPTALMKPFSGSGARAMLIETMQNFGVDSFPALTAATIQGSTETTFYVVAVYFGAVGIKHTRHTIPCALFAELIGVLAGILVCYAFFG